MPASWKRQLAQDLHGSAMPGPLRTFLLKIRVALSRQLSDPEMMSKYLFEPITRCFDFALGGSHSLPAGVPMAMTPTPRHPPDHITCNPMGVDTVPLAAAATP